MGYVDVQCRFLFSRLQLIYSRFYYQSDTQIGGWILSRTLISFIPISFWILCLTAAFIARYIS